MLSNRKLQIALEKMGLQKPQVRADKKDQSGSYVTHYQQNGPGGQFDMWKMQEDACPWIVKEPIQKTKRKLKIIFCHPLLATFTKSKLELSLLTLFTMRHSVYLWRGEHTDLTNDKPLTEAQLYLNMGKCVAATKNQVNKILAQRENNDEFIILDSETYSEILYQVSLNDEGENRLRDTMQSKASLRFSESLDLSAVNLQDANIRKLLKNSIDVMNVLHVTLLNPRVEEMQFVRKRFVALQSINIKNIDWSCFNAIASLLEGLSVTLCKYQDSILDVKEEINLTELIVRQSEKLCLIDFTKLKVKTLQLDNYHSGLSLINIANSQIEEAIIHYSGFINSDNQLEDFLDIPSLKKIKISMIIVSDHARYEHFKMCHHGITHLVVKDCPDFEHVKVDLNNFKKLTHLEISHSTVTVMPGNLKIFESLSVFPSKINVPDNDNQEVSIVCDYAVMKLSSLFVFGLDNKPKTPFVSLPLDVTDLTMHSVRYETREKKLEVGFLEKENAFERLDINKTIKYSGERSIDQLNIITGYNLDRVTASLVRRIDTLDLSEFNSLFKLVIGKCTIRKIIFPPSLRQLESDADFLHFNISSMPNLVDLDYKCSLRKINLQSDSLKNLTLRDENSAKEIGPGTLDLSPSGPNKLNSLESLVVKEVTPNFFLFKLDNLPNLKEIKLIFNFEGKALILDVGNCSALRSISISNGRQGYGYNTAFIQVLNVTNCINLQEIIVQSETTILKYKGIETCKALKVAPVAMIQGSAATMLQAPLAVPEHESNVSVYDADEVSFTPDLKIEKNSIFKSSGGYVVALFQGDQPCRKEYYRLQVFTNLTRSPDSQVIEFNCAVQEKHVEQLNVTFATAEKISERIAQIKKLKSKDYYGCFEGKLTPGKYYALPNMQAIREMNKNKIMLYSESLDAIDIFWHPAHQMHYLRLKKGEKAQVVNVKFVIAHDKGNHYAKLPVENAIVASVAEQLLSDSIRKTLENKLKEHKDWIFLFAKETTKNEKVSALISIYKKILDENNTAKIRKSKNIKNNLDVLIEIILTLNPRYACRHRAQTFVLLLHYLNVPACLIYSENHVFCEIPYLVGVNREWHRLDLGGIAAIDMTPKKLRKNPFKSKLAQPAVAKKSANAEKFEQEDGSLLLPEKIIMQDPIKTAYQEKFAKITQPEKISSILSLLENPETQSPLIFLTPEQDALDVHRVLLQQLQDTEWSREDFLYIHRPEDFMLFLRPYQLKNNEWKKIDGPLNTLLETGGVIIVNWSNFTPTQIAIYKSLLDTFPTLEGRPSEKLKVIGLIAANMACSPVFLTRCKRFVIDIQTTPSATPQLTADKESLSVDLFHSPAWRQKLFGKEKRKGSEITLKEGKLIQALRKNQALIIYNPPDDPLFTLLLHRVLAERRLLFNGEVLNVASNVSIHLATRDNVTKLDNVRIAIKENKFLQHKRIYLGMHNLYDCEGRLLIEDHKAAQYKGLLDAYDSDSDVFYLTDSIPLDDWQALLLHIKKHYPDKMFQVLLAPGVKINDVERSFALQEKPSGNIILSEDTDYTSENLRACSADNTLVVPVTLQTQFQDLIYKIEHYKEADTGQVKFNYQEHKILQALLAGKTVVLNGEVSPMLYSQLLSLLCEQGFFYLQKDHGIERVSVPGRLKIVMPLAVKETLSLVDYVEEYYPYKTLDDYKKLFPKARIDALKSINQFYQWVARYPHVGLGRPEKLRPCHKHIERLLFALDNPHPLHRANPVKGLFLYDYPRESEDYAYLNVIAKYCFAGDYAGREKSKLAALAQSREQVQEQCWKILNCFSGKALHSILGDDLSQAITIKNTYPTLSAAALSRLQKALSKHKKPPRNPKSQSRVEKQQAQLAELLHLPGPFILLKGEPGVGKTYCVNQVLGGKHRLFRGINALPEWLAAIADPTSDDYVFLFLDEATMEKPGTWDFLKGLSYDGRRVYWQGEFYELSPRHRVIATGNPETESNRYHHALFRYAGETLYFSMPDEKYLIEHVILKTTASYGIDLSDNIVEGLLYAYHLIGRYHTTLTLSIRDLENLSLRLVMLMQARDYNGNAREALLRASCAEFAGAIKALEKRQGFINELSEKLQVRLPVTETELIYLTDDLAIPQEKEYLLEAIEQDLQLRAMSIAAAKAGKPIAYFKTGILIEGDSGEGKSTFYKAVLAKHGIDYYEITAGSVHTEEKLLQAFREGKVVILDEVNLDKPLEILLNQLLTGVDHDGNKAAPGFMVCASKNPRYFAGCFAISMALRNRFHLLYMDAFSEKELLAIATARGVPQAQDFVAAYLAARAAAPQHINMRTFYHVLKEVQPENKKIVRSKKGKERINEDEVDPEIERKYREIIASAQLPEDKKEAVAEVITIKEEKENKSVRDVPPDQRIPAVSVPRPAAEEAPALKPSYFQRLMHFVQHNYGKILLGGLIGALLVGAVIGGLFSFGMGAVVLGAIGAGIVSAVIGAHVGAATGVAVGAATLTVAGVAGGTVVGTSTSVVLQHKKSTRINRIARLPVEEVEEVQPKSESTQASAAVNDPTVKEEEQNAPVPAQFMI